jgi:Zn-dependent protease
VFNYISSYLDNPLQMLLLLAIALPGRLLAISMHEAAHAWVANKCGDPTARMLGRVTLNPLKHLDLFGTLMMVFVGFGWAKPVPVNPRNFRHYRRDDILVSVAGVTTNFIMFFVSCILLYVFVGIALARAASGAVSGMSVETYAGAAALINGTQYVTISDVLRYAIYMSDYLITPVFGQIAGYGYEVLMYFVLTNLVLGVFNLIPVPPLDGYHVVNDLLLKRSVFASPRATQIATLVLFGLMFTGVISTAIGAVQDAMFGAAGSVFGHIFQALGIY